MISTILISLTLSFNIFMLLYTYKYIVDIETLIVKQHKDIEKNIMNVNRMLSEAITLLDKLDKHNFDIKHKQLENNFKKLSSKK